MRRHHQSQHTPPPQYKEKRNMVSRYGSNYQLNMTAAAANFSGGGGSAALQNHQQNGPPPSIIPTMPHNLTMKTGGGGGIGGVGGASVVNPLDYHCSVVPPPPHHYRIMHPSKLLHGEAYKNLLLIL